MFFPFHFGPSLCISTSSGQNSYGDEESRLKMEKKKANLNYYDSSIISVSSDVSYYQREDT